MEIKRLKDLLVGWEDIPLDLYTPVSAFLKLRNKGATYLLESVEKGEKVGRYSFIGFEPEMRLSFFGKDLRINGKKTTINKSEARFIFDEIFEAKYLDEFEETVFWGGWVGYIGYEFVQFLEEIELREKLKSPFPDVILFKSRGLIVFDHVKNTAKIIVSGKNNSENESERIASYIKNLLFSNSRIHERKRERFSRFSYLKQSIDEKEFLERVRKTKEYIKNGDIFQAVISIRFESETSADPFDIYRALRILNPSPYMFYIDFGDFQLIGSSPESHVKVTKDFVSIRPIAGTRRRGRNKEEDLELEKQLVNNEKERAEHVMLIDLARNDLGKICIPGSVRISEKMTIERYSHVMHIVSQVDGNLEKNISFFDILRATFPAGTVTGAPKLRAMEIIDEMEPAERGPYGGVVGYLGFNGNMDLCIGIRMIVYYKGKYFLQAGAGIVDGSIPENEYKEIKNKIKGMQEAVIIAEEGRLL